MRRSGIALCLSAGLLAIGLAPTLATAGPHLRKPKRGFQMRVHKYTIEPGEDLEMCDYRRLPNGREMIVDGFEVRMPPGAHHFVVWSYGGNLTDKADFPTKPVESVGCTGLVSDDVIPSVLIPIQSPNSRFQFPAGVGMRIVPHQQVWLNPHMKSGDTKPFSPDIRFNFYEAKKGSVQHIAEGMIVGNTKDIAIPAGGDQTITAEWTAPVDLNLVQLATHQHRLGTYANVEIVEPDGVTVTRIYENEDWEHPHNFWPQPALRLAKGQKMRITCSWHNTDDHMVHFGPETTDEMCFILGYYYRDPGDTTPAEGSSCIGGKNGGLLCVGAPAINP